MYLSGIVFNKKPFISTFLIPILIMGWMLSSSIAHDASLTYTTISIDSNKVNLKITIPMDALSSILPNQDWYEPVKDASSFVDYFNKKFIITNEGMTCKTKLIANRCLKNVRECSFSFEIISDATFDHLSFLYNMFFEYSSTHENIANFIIGNRNNEFIFSKDKNSIAFSVNELRIQYGLQPFSNKINPKNDSIIFIANDTIKSISKADNTFIEKEKGKDSMTSAMLPPSIQENTKPFEGNDTWKRFLDFFIIGVEHILTGYDHIMFLMGLLLMINGMGNLLKVITAFTIAHSITLGIAVFGIYAVPSALTESMIALSISFIAFENIYIQRLQTHSAHKAKGFLSNFIGDAKKRWRLTFFFGLIHGFGFSAALREIGMPEGTRAISLFSFNLGVEAGQLMIVAAVFPFLWYARKKIYYNLMVRIISIAIGVAGIALVFQRICFPELF